MPMDIKWIILGLTIIVINYHMNELTHLLYNKMAKNSFKIGRLKSKNILHTMKILVLLKGASCQTGHLTAG